MSEVRVTSVCDTAQSQDQETQRVVSSGLFVEQSHTSHRFLTVRTGSASSGNCCDLEIQVTAAGKSHAQVPEADSLWLAGCADVPLFISVPAHTHSAEEVRLFVTNILKILFLCLRAHVLWLGGVQWGSGLSPGGGGRLALLSSFLSPLRLQLLLHPECRTQPLLVPPPWGWRPGAANHIQVNHLGVLIRPWTCRDDVRTVTLLHWGCR